MKTPWLHLRKLTSALSWVFLSGIQIACTVAADESQVDPALREKLALALADQHEHIDKFDAAVWLQVSDQRLERFLRQSDERLDLLKFVYGEATRQGLDPDLVLAVMQIESTFNRFAISSVGAQGLMQVMPFWRNEIGRPQDNLTHVETNIRYGTVILAHYMQVAKGDMVEALARYNGSYGRLKYPDKVLTAWRRTWRNKAWGDVPEFQASCARYSLKACLYQ
ncbi:MAG: lytic transglycosylase domain-containing protein [Pseudomonadota bacterium]